MGPTVDHAVTGSIPTPDGAVVQPPGCKPRYAAICKYIERVLIDRLRQQHPEPDSVLAKYLEEKIVDRSPFETIDKPGVGWLVRLAAWVGREHKPDLKIGICGEHGGDPDSIDFFHMAGLDYVSCSPYRVPIARVAAAQAAIAHSG